MFGVTGRTGSLVGGDSVISILDGSEKEVVQVSIICTIASFDGLDDRFGKGLE